MGNPTLINNAANFPISFREGTVPDVSGALTDWFQPMTFESLVKTQVGFQAVETPTVYNFQGIIMNFTERQLMLRPEGERAWTWLLLFADFTLELQVDDVVLYKGVQTRVMGREAHYDIYGYVTYKLCQDWTGSGP